ncbi:GNAT family N-acetyltransferase [Myroides odoratimimus]|uniref:GNAT family N-acetyltransferase n=1 Tax=Myroides odoratimimus TaxID=76832 RepID=UPI002DBA6120|nr:GNAT family N-acetyltransferase [Myroides odoratimimus]MEC4034336.1 GNAT family N-acetyltransferase [Myroides odoratimimus]
MIIEFKTKTFEALTNKEFYEILKLRSEVFIVEQNCVYQDIDGKDIEAHHLMCFIEGNLAGYARLLPTGISYQEASIGRVAIAMQYRGLKIGKVLMQNAIVTCDKLFENTPIRIGAQAYLIKFYNSLGFTVQGKIYDEDGIPHVEMLRIK